MSAPMFREARTADLDHLVAMNNAAMPAVSWLDVSALKNLAIEACWFTVSETEGDLSGFLVGFDGPGRDYESLNYQAFSGMYPDGFLYVDRVVIAPRSRNNGLGLATYDEFVTYGQDAGHAVLTAEVNVRPRNDGSLRFHRRYGFRPVGEQDTGDKRVQLLAYDLTGAAPILDRDSVVDQARESDPDLADRLEFFLDIDRLKTVQRVTRIADGTRRENTAEHSWHLALLAMALEPLAAEPVDLDQVIKILLVHDIVEADAGDTYIFDEEAARQKEALENEAADRIFALLPGDEGAELRALWDEYENPTTPEGRFALACDRVQPFLLNAVNGGGPWIEKEISAAKVQTAMTDVRIGTPRLADLTDQIIAKAVEDGFLEADDG